MPTHMIFSGFGITGRNLISGNLVVGAAMRGGFRDLRQQAAGDRLAQRGGVATEPLVHGDHAIAGDDAVHFLPVGDIACEFHDSLHKG